MWKKNGSLIRFFLFLLLAPALIPAAPSKSERVLVLEKGVPSYSLLPYLDYLQTDRELSVEALGSGKFASRFVPNRRETLTFGHTLSDVWLRFTLRNNTANTNWMIISPGMISTLEFHAPDKHGRFRSRRTGLLHPLTSRDIVNHNYVFRLKLKKGARVTCYLKQNSTQKMTVQLSLLTAAEFHHQDHNAQLALGIYYGVLLSMLAFNLILYFFLRDISYFYIVFFLASWIFTQLAMDGLAVEYIWTNAPWWNSRLVYFATALVGLSGFLFAIRFLSLKTIFHGGYRYSQFMMLLSSFHATAALIWNNIVVHTMNDVLVLIYVLSGIGIGSICYFRGFKAARFYIIAWSAFFAGTMVYILSTTFRIGPYNAITANGMRIGAALIAILLSIALADRYRLLRIEKETYQRLSAEQANFFINLSHEIKTPLTLIANYLDEYISARGMTPELSVVRRNIEKLLTDMINFFDVLKFEKGLEIHDHSRLVDFSALLLQKEELFKSLVHNKKIDLVFLIENGLLLRADPLAVERIINNLIENAVRYSAAGARIEVTLKKKDERLIFSVSDNGPGIEESRQKRIFDPYYQISHEKRNIEGIGMGLSIVKGIVTSLGGHIDLKSTPGQGSTFTITLNAAVPRPGDVLADGPVAIRPFLRDTTAVESHTVSSGVSDFTVFLIEDNAELLSLLETGIGRYHTVRTAVNGEEALRLLGENPAVDIIVSDIMMDGMDGFEFFNAALQVPRLKDIPVIFLTARSTPEDRIQGLRLGAIDYIYKPFMMEELISRIDSQLRFQKLQRAIHERDKFASLGMLLGGIAHEIFNPLSGITGPLVNLKRRLTESGSETNEVIARYIRSIEEGVSRITRIIHTIRALYSGGRLPREEIRPARIITAVVENFQDDSENNFEIELDIDSGLTVTGNDEALGQITTNLLNNAADAIKASADAGGDGRINVSLTTDNGSVLLRVTDNGGGMSAAEMENAFDAFFTTRGPVGGIGLGLNIVKNLTLKLGWDVKIESTPGKGTTVTVSMEK